INGEEFPPKHFQKHDEDISFTLENPTPGEASVFKIILPSWANPIFQGLELDDGASLLPLEDMERPVYIALGDSITHGTGQGSASYDSYPYILSEKLDYSFYNLAIGGSQISFPIAESLRYWDDVEVIT